MATALTSSIVGSVIPLRAAASQIRTVRSPKPPETMTSVAEPADGHRAHPAGMAGEGFADRVAVGVPNPHRRAAGAAAGDDDVAVAEPADGHRAHRAGVARKGLMRGVGECVAPGDPSGRWRLSRGRTAASSRSGPGGQR